MTLLCQSFCVTEVCLKLRLVTSSTVRRKRSASTSVNIISKLKIFVFAPLELEPVPLVPPAGRSNSYISKSELHTAQHVVELVDQKKKRKTLQSHFVVKNTRQSLCQSCEDSFQVCCVLLIAYKNNRSCCGLL